MRSRSSMVVLILGFGTLIVLIAVLGFIALRRARAIYAEMEATQNSYLATEAFRRDIVSDMYLADILVRDYLLDPAPQNVQMHRQQLLEIRESLQQRLDTLSPPMSDSDDPGLDRLRKEVQGYWESLDPIFEWTTQEKSELSWGFLRRKVLPRRRAVIDLAREMARLNKENLEHERQRIRASQQDFHRFLIHMLAFVIPLGALVALVTTYRVAALENRHEQQRKQIAEAENNLRRLSRRLVQAQELERKALSRELHDEVGQTLTALGMELGNLQAVRQADPAKFRAHVDDLKRLNADAMRAVRDLAMGLRPSMLDDLGLAPALEWQGREFSRHTGVPATVHVEGSLDELPEAHRTCIYRVVQEALTNCAKHANATNVRVSMEANDHRVRLLIEDDGVGFDSEAGNKGGLGLLGIKERVQEIDGTVRISSAIQRGTRLEAVFPVGSRNGAEKWAKPAF
jgi:signal transduction histidine kinase